MRFVSLGSGSRGNATLIESGDTRLLLDCGFAMRELERRLALLGVAADSLCGILVTHEHQDHIQGVGAFARRYRLPVWLTQGTWLSGARRLGTLPVTHRVRGEQAFRVGAIQVEPYLVPHDAREPVQYVFRANGSRLGVLTDAGTITPHILEMLSACNALMLECNHDTDMLASGPYPPALQRRVGGDMGHLSNGQAARLLTLLDHTRLECLLIAHLSEKNNTPALARAALTGAVPGIDSRLTLTRQDDHSGWLSA